jgi:hypothetical protein
MLGNALNMHLLVNRLLRTRAVLVQRPSAPAGRPGPRQRHS